MPGILVHLLAGTICAIVIFTLFKKKEYSFTIFIGNLLPDLVGVVYSSLTVRSIDPTIIFKSAAWESSERLLVTQLFWILLQSIFVIFFLIPSKSRWKKKIDENIIAMLLLGFIIHITMDIFIINQGIWI